MGRVYLTVLLLGVLAPAAAAQDAASRFRELPPGTERQLVMLFRDPETVRKTGPVRIAADSAVTGNLVVFDGSVVLTGRIDGTLVVVNGDVTFRPGSAVGGDVTVVGGEARGVDGAGIGGTLTVYSPGFAYAPAEDASRPRGRGDREWREEEWGDVRLALRAGEAYNRVEGLTLRFGPVIRTAGPSPTRLEALAIWRSEQEPLDPDNMGYRVRLEQFLGGDRAFRIGAGAHSTVEPVESWKIRDLEAGLSTFLLHSDPRDYYEQTGWNVYVRANPFWPPVDAVLEFRSDEYDVAPVADPFTLFRRNRAWRAQPLVATGELRSVAAHLTVDTRDRRREPTRGWFLHTTARRGLGGSLALPAVANDVTPEAAPGEVDTDLTHLFVDLRRYTRIAPGAVLALRTAAGGSVADAGLPPQFQHTLGGLGTLPGFSRFAADCGARSRTRVPLASAPTSPPYFPAYGCDRFALVQVEVRSEFGVDVGIGDDEPEEDDLEWWSWAWDVDFDPAWTVFFDAGKGWALEGPAPLEGRDTDLLYDVGAGLLLDRLGLYAAYPLNGTNRDLRIFLRLDRRF